MLRPMLENMQQTMQQSAIPFTLTTNTNAVESPIATSNFVIDTMQLDPQDSTLNESIHWSEWLTTQSNEIQALAKCSRFDSGNVFVCTEKQETLKRAQDDPMTWLPVWRNLFAHQCGCDFMVAHPKLCKTILTYRTQEAWRIVFNLSLALKATTVTDVRVLRDTIACAALEGLEQETDPVSVRLRLSALKHTADQHNREVLVHLHVIPRVFSATSTSAQAKAILTSMLIFRE